MKTLLRLAALLSAVWVLVLVVFREMLLPRAVTVATSSALETAAATATALANTMIIVQTAFVFLFLHAAREPRRHKATVYTAIGMMAAKVILDLYHSLVLLPADIAIFTILDLVLSFALLVGMLEGLPRLLSEPQR